MMNVVWTAFTSIGSGLSLMAILCAEAVTEHPSIHLSFEADACFVGEYLVELFHSGEGATRGTAGTLPGLL